MHHLYKTFGIANMQELQLLIQQGVLQAEAAARGARLPYGGITQADLQKIGKAIVGVAVDDPDMPMSDWVKLRGDLNDRWAETPLKKLREIAGPPDGVSPDALRN